MPTYVELQIVGFVTPHFTKVTTQDVGAALAEHLAIDGFEVVAALQELLWTTFSCWLEMV